jgi:signal transduction histidine kinase
MNGSLARDLSIYQQIVSAGTTSQAQTFSPATLLSMMRSHIDILIERKISATLWVKLPPGDVWQSELQRYQQQVYDCGKIYSFQIGEGIKIQTEDEINLSHPCHFPIYFPPKSRLRREYFLLILSPQFSSLIVAYRPLRGIKKNNPKKTNSGKIPLLVAINTFEGKIIQPIVDNIQAAFTQLEAFKLTLPAIPESSIISQLLLRQFYNQEKINRQITNIRLNKLRRQNQKTHQALQLKDDYLNTVCQELRTPLTHMKTALSLLNSPVLKAPQRQRYLQMLSTECDRQNSLIMGITELVELERSLKSPNFEAVELADIVPGVVSTYQPLAQERDIMLAYTVPQSLPSVWFLSGGVKQIVINLLSNSIKFTPNGGEVWVKARHQGDYIQIEIRDTGIGIAESEISKIFNSFYHLRPATSDELAGVGLGLTIVQQMLHRCGGSISVKSKQNEGTTFTVQLAIAKQQKK